MLAGSGRGGYACEAVQSERRHVSERFNVKLEEYLSGQEGKNSRIMTDDDHEAAVDFIWRSESSEAQQQEGKHRRWLRNLSIVDNPRSLTGSTIFMSRWATPAGTRWLPN